MAFGAKDIGINRFRNQIQCVNLSVEKSTFHKSRLTKPGVN